MKDVFAPPPQSDLRPPSEVMRLSRMGSMFPTRLSFLRVLTRQLAQERAQLTRLVWSMDQHGYGHAVYTIQIGGRPYSLVAVSNDLPDDMRTDRVIATAWDTAYVLFDGEPDPEDIARITREAARQEAGRFTASDLVLSRANKSVRLFRHVIDRLKAGQQPDPAEIAKVGYLMRTTAVYGNGKFGIADRALIADRPGLKGAFAAEMLTVWMIRCFTHDLAEHLGGAPLSPEIRRMLGIGNSTGLGMAPFLVSHPVLLNNWIIARETALARVRAQAHLDAEQVARLQSLARRAAAAIAIWQVPDAGQMARISLLRKEWQEICNWLDQPMPERPLNALMTHVANTFSLETQELCVALLLEPFDDLVDGLAECMTDPFGPMTEPFEDVADLRTAIETAFDWALDLDFEDPEQIRLFWYVSEEKQEPRLGDRFDEPGAERETPLDIARRVQALYTALEDVRDLRAFRAAAPQHELAITRVAIARAHPYADIRDNLIAGSCRPIDMLRCKLSFFGASGFDPKSDRWTRVTLAQGAPLPEEIAAGDGDDWWLAGAHT